MALILIGLFSFLLTVHKAGQEDSKYEEHTLTRCSSRGRQRKHRKNDLFRHDGSLDTRLRREEMPRKKRKVGAEFKCKRRNNTVNSWILWLTVVNKLVNS